MMISANGRSNQCPTKQSARGHHHNHDRALQLLPSRRASVKGSLGSKAVEFLFFVKGLVFVPAYPSRGKRREEEEEGGEEGGRRIESRRVPGLPAETLPRRQHRKAAKEGPEAKL